MSLILGHRGEFLLARPTLILDLLQLEDGLGDVQRLALVAQLLLVHHAGLSARVDHVALLTDITNVHCRLTGHGNVCGADQVLEVGKRVAVLGVVGDGCACVGQLALHVSDGLRRDLQQRQGGTECRRVIHEHTLGSCKYKQQEDLVRIYVGIHDM